MKDLVRWKIEQQEAYCATVTFVLYESSCRKSASQREIWQTCGRTRKASKGATGEVSDRKHAWLAKFEWGTADRQPSSALTCTLDMRSADKVLVPYRLVKAELGGNHKGRNRQGCQLVTEGEARAANCALT